MLNATNSNIAPGTADWFIRDILVQEDKALELNVNMTKDEMNNYIANLEIDLNNLASLLPGKTTYLIENLHRLQDIQTQGLQPGNLEFFLDVGNQLAVDAGNLTQNSEIGLDQIRVTVGDLDTVAANLFLNGDLNGDDSFILAAEALNTLAKDYENMPAGSSPELDLCIQNLLSYLNHLDTLNPENAKTLLSDIQVIMTELPEPSDITN